MSSYVDMTAKHTLISNTTLSSAKRTRATTGAPLARNQSTESAKQFKNLIKLDSVFT